MKYQSFIMRVLCLLLIVGAVLGYNSMQKKDSDAEKRPADRQSDNQSGGLGKTAG